MPANKPTNPFYIILVVVGIIFVITACSYFVMTLQGREASYGRAERANQAFVQLVDRYGFTALMVELGILAAATFAAMATDEHWTRVAENRKNEDDEAEPETETAPGNAELHDEGEPPRSD